MFTAPIGFLNPVTDNPLDVNLAHAWLFEGGSLLDSAGNNDGTAFNTPTLVSGINGEANGAYAFNKASSEYISFGNIAELEGVSNFTISTWVYKLSGATEMSLGKWLSANYGIMVQWGGGDGHMNIVVRNNTATHHVLQASAYWGTWVNVVTTFDGAQSDGNRVKVYANSILDPSAVIFPSLTDSQGYAFEIARILGTNYSTGSNTRTRIYTDTKDQAFINLLYAEKTV